MVGKIIKLISNDYTVLCNDKLIICKARGKFRNDNIKPLVGDNVKIDLKNSYILEVLPRMNELVRPPVSNIDQIIIVMSVKEPDFSTNLLDKLLVIIEYNNIKPIICLTKMDLLSKEEHSEISKYISYYQKIGYKIFNNTDISDFSLIFKNKISVFTGQSGAGKSTLLNMLNSDLHLKTGIISKALGRGKHTTRHVELMNVNGGYIADTPGFSDISFIGMSKSDIRDNFIEFNEYKQDCKYRDCMHDKEDDCAIKEAVENGNIIESRYQDYLKFISKE
ncbi:MAG: ribosome small subunit-dependent GTPase A [Bacilli bacterium]|nr:ribosome small subunit-dependent GTPase A [Bacilli bacterium]